MPPFLALILTFGFIVYLFRQDRREAADLSGALWLPLCWMLIYASRLPSQWLSLQNVGSAAQIYEEGNVFDRIVFLILILLSIQVLRQRRVAWFRLLQANLPLTIFLGYCFLSISWSDFYFIAFKRWVKDLGIYLTILVAVTDARRFEAVCILFRRFAYLTVPLSITFIKYFPELGVQYDGWTGQSLFTGITSDKNALGGLCLVTGLFFVWDTLRRWKHRANDRKMLSTNLCFLGFILWLLKLAGSATSLLCFLVGVGSLLLFQLTAIKRNPKRISVLLILGVLILLSLDFVFDLTSTIISMVGRDTTLTERTYLWRDIQDIAFNPFFGTGYESFWLGDRLQKLWSLYPWEPNQAHNGYFETYINLGLVGLTLLCIFLLSTFLKLRNSLLTEFQCSLFGITLLCSLLLYNITEAAFKPRLIWYAFLISAIGVAIGDERHTQESKHELSTKKDPRAKCRFGAFDKLQTDLTGLPVGRPSEDA